MNPTQLAQGIRKVGLGTILGACTAGGMYGLREGNFVLMILSGLVGIYTLTMIAKEEGQDDV